MLGYDVSQQAEPQDPEWVVLVAAVFREDSLSRRGAVYRLLYLTLVVGLIVLAFVAEGHG